MGTGIKITLKLKFDIVLPVSVVVSLYNKRYLTEDSSGNILKSLLSVTRPYYRSIVSK